MTYLSKNRRTRWEMVGKITKGIIIWTFSPFHLSLNLPTQLFRKIQLPAMVLLYRVILRKDLKTSMVKSLFGLSKASIKRIFKAVALAHYRKVFVNWLAPKITYLIIDMTGSSNQKTVTLADLNLNVATIINFFVYCCWMLVNKNFWKKSMANFAPR